MPFDAILIVGLYIACELIANITAGKPVALPGGITVPAAVFIYALTFTLIDLVNDRLGKQGARYVVYAAFLSNLLLAAYTQFAMWLPPAPFYGEKGHVSALYCTSGKQKCLAAALIKPEAVIEMVETTIGNRTKPAHRQGLL